MFLQLDTDSSPCAWNYDVGTSVRYIYGLDSSISSVFGLIGADS